MAAKHSSGLVEEPQSVGLVAGLPSMGATWHQKQLGGSLLEGSLLEAPGRPAAQRQIWLKHFLAAQAGEAAPSHPSATEEAAM